MEKKICLITGATSGIGREAALEIARRGHVVVLVSRDKSRGENTLQDIQQQTGSTSVVMMQADLASRSEIEKLSREFKKRFDRLDVLINNAGLYIHRRSLNEEGIEKTFAINHLAYFQLTLRLLDLLKASAPSRIVNVSSGAHRGASMRFDDLYGEQDYNGLFAYGQSKLANLLFTYELARRIEGTGVTVNAIHPGTVGTRFWNQNENIASRLMRLFKPFMLSPAKSARAVVHLALAPELEGVSGKYFNKEKESRSSAASYDQDSARRLWEISEDLVSPGRS